jgi:hypothetical protein
MKNRIKKKAKRVSLSVLNLTADKDNSLTVFVINTARFFLNKKNQMKYKTVKPKPIISGTIYPENPAKDFNSWCIYIHTTDLKNKF